MNKTVEKVSSGTPDGAVKTVVAEKTVRKTKAVKKEKPKVWTGDELGRIALAEIAKNYDRANRLKQGYIDPYNDPEFQKRLQTLSPVEYEKYKNYGVLLTWISNNILVTQNQVTMSELQIVNLTHIVLRLTASENLMEMIKTPDKEVRTYLGSLSLNTYTPEFPFSESNVSSLDSIRSQILRGIYHILGFNKLIDLISEKFNIKELKYYKKNLEVLKNKLDKLNGYIINLYIEIKESSHNPPVLKQQKLEVLRDHFSPIDISKFRIPKVNVIKALESMDEFMGFQGGAIDPYLQLCILDLKVQSKNLFLDLDKITSDKRKRG